MASSRGPTNRLRVQDLAIAEDVKINIERALRIFVEDESAIDYQFPSSLTNEERKFIHNVAHQYGLTTKSFGGGKDRALVAYKKDRAVARKTGTFDLQKTSRQMIMSLLRQNPLNDREKQSLIPEKSQRIQPGDRNVPVHYYAAHPADPLLACTTGRLTTVIPQIPPPLNNSDPDILTAREQLPIRPHREEILNNILRNQVLLISGETGCGKTTQVPQYILEHAAEKRQPCRILVAEPRRLAALSVADRVSQERGEQIGQLVGYQIRLESKVSPRTLLTFCTNGVLLRTLMGGDASMKTVTHIIVDEIHERDRFSDLLLAVIRELLPHMPHLTLILMSATFDTERFVQYFNCCPILTIPGRLYDVKYYFLEDILRLTGYNDKVMKHYAQKYHKEKKFESQNLISWCPEGKDIKKEEAKTSTDQSDAADSQYHEKAEYYQQLGELLKEGWSDGGRQCFEDLLSLIINEELDVNYKHPETGVTPLIVTASRGAADVAEALLEMGADTSVRTKLNDFDAAHWANHFGHTELADLICSYAHAGRQAQEDEADQVARAAIAEEDKLMLEAYHRTFNDDEVDMDLILTLTKHICLNSESGAILIFLPGYDHIVTLKHMIVETFAQCSISQFVLFTLHSQMQNDDHRRVFYPPPQGQRKIVLSTNIAETSVTIEDVVYVIDCGKVKVKSYDPTTGVSDLKAERISQASALQRRGRAGRCRPGVCYHIYSRFRFENLEKFPVPEIMRMPAHELCLQVKLLAPNMPLAEFISRLPDPPPASSIKNSIELLKAIDALEPVANTENLTELGLLLLDLPIEPHLGKVVLYSVVMKCLDPILTIVCCVTYKDPFVIPMDPRDKRKAQEARNRFSSNSLSDHMALLRAFQGWQRAKCGGFDRPFCEQNYISSSTMDMIFGIRTQLLGQLRASGFVKARGQSDVKDLNTNSENWAVVKAVLCAGYYPNILRLDKNSRKLMTRKDPRIMFHLSSVLGPLTSKEGRGRRTDEPPAASRLPSDWFIYDELCRSGRVSMARMCTIVSPITLALMAGPLRLPSDAFVSIAPEEELSSSGEESENPGPVPVTLKLDDWISFRLTPEVGNLIWQLRQKWHSFFLRRISNPARPVTNPESVLIKTIADILNLEEQAIGIPQPAGVGQRPAPMASSFCSPVLPSPHSITSVQRHPFMNRNPRQQFSAGYSGGHYQYQSHHQQQHSPRSQNPFRRF